MSSLSSIAAEDKKIRESFEELRKETFELEKLKYKRMQEAAEKQLGVDITKRNSSTNNTNNKNQEEGLGILANWRKICVLAFFLILLNWRRFVNLYDLTFNNNDGRESVMSVGGPGK